MKRLKRAVKQNFESLATIIFRSKFVNVSRSRQVLHVCLICQLKS